MRLIFVTLSHYPHSGACSSLIKKMTNEMQNVDGLDIHIIAMKQTPTEGTTTYDKTTVHRIWWWTMVNKEKLRSWRKSYPLIYVKGFLNKTMAKLSRSVLKKDFIDQSVVHNIEQKLEELPIEKDDIIIPVAGHYEAVKATLNYTRKHTAVKSVIYQVDPCLSNTAYSAKTKRQRMKFERQMCEHADAIITTPILLEEMQANLAYAQRGKITAMEFPNISTRSRTYPTRSTSGTSYTCVFAGAIYQQARNPSYTFKLFAALKNRKVCLHMVGVERQIAAGVAEKGTLLENAQFYGIVPLEEAQRHMEEADILVNIGNSMMNQVPSKIFEYISMGKPIVNICTSHECPTLPYLKKYPYVLNLFECDHNFDEQVQKLEDFIVENAGKSVSAVYIMKTYETCTAQYCAKQMLDIIKNIAEH